MVPEIWSVTDRMLCHFGPFFALLPLKNLKNQNFEKMKKVPGDVIILHKCTKNHDHMLHCSWDTICDKCNSFFYFGLCFGPLTTQKIKILKKWKKHLEISSFYTCVPKILITWCTVPEIWCTTDGQTASIVLENWMKGLGK